MHRLAQRRRETWITPRRQTKFRSWTLAADHKERLRTLVAAQPDRTLAELRLQPYAE